MFYISSVQKKYIGVTDTDDGIEEWYTREQIMQFLTEYQTVIKGAEVKNSVLQLTVTCPQIAEIERYAIGTPFEIHKDGEIQYFVKMGDVGTEGFRVYDGKFNFIVLQRNIFISDKDIVVCECNNVAWFSEFKAWFKKHQPMTCERLYK